MRRPPPIVRRVAMAVGVGSGIVVYLIFIIGVLNFVLGYALATYLEPRPAIEAEPVGERVAPAAEPEPVEMSESTYFDIGSEETPQAEPEAVVEEIPSDWLEALESESIEAKSFVEASVQVLKLEVGRYRADLMAIEEQIRQYELSHDREEIHALLERLKTLNEDWLAKQGDAAKHLQSRNGTLGDFEEMGGGLEDVLLEQAAQIETTCSNIEMLDFESDVGAGCKRLITEVCRLVDLAHQLRDRMQESMISIMQADKRLGDLDRKLQFDSMTTLHNRTGLEVMFHEWWREDLIRQRTVSVVMVDIDHFAHLNGQYGTRMGDLLLGAFGKLLEELIRKDTGYDVAARFAGSTFVLFFGDTGPRGATSTTEQVRQTIEMTTFECPGQAIELTVSCGVVEVGKKETTKGLFKRLRRTLREAKKAGRNRTSLDEGNGPQTVQPPTFQVTGRVVPVTE